MNLRSGASSTAQCRRDMSKPRFFENGISADLMPKVPHDSWLLLRLGAKNPFWSNVSSFVKDPHYKQFALENSIENDKGRFRKRPDLDTTSIKLRSPSFHGWVLREKIKGCRYHINHLLRTCDTRRV